MQLAQQFSLPIPVEDAWEVLLDIERVASCMPGATVESIHGDEFTGNVTIKLGPMVLTFRSEGELVAKDPRARKVLLKVTARDIKGNGTAEATVTAVLAGDGRTTMVRLVTDLLVTGRAAQFGPAVLNAVGDRLIRQFAETLSAQLASQAISPEGGQKARATEPLDALDLAGLTPKVRRAIGVLAAAVVVLAVVRVVRGWLT